MKTNDAAAAAATTIVNTSNFNKIDLIKFLESNNWTINFIYVYV